MRGKQAMKNDKINEIVQKKLKLSKGKVCQRCGWWLESKSMATYWGKNIYTHIKCNREKLI
jgi:hypothetical protein